MKPLTILDDLLEQLKSRELSYILIPCDNIADARNLACKLGERNVKWLSADDVRRYNNNWTLWKEHSLYVIQRSIVSEAIKLKVLHIHDFIWYEDTYHVVLHPHAVINSQL